MNSSFIYFWNEKSKYPRAPFLIFTECIRQERRRENGLRWGRGGDNSWDRYRKSSHRSISTAAVMGNTTGNPFEHL